MRQQTRRTATLVCVALVVVYGGYRVVWPFAQNTLLSMTTTTGFDFEDYDSAEAVQSALLQLHPIGSETSLLLRRLEGSDRPHGSSNKHLTYRYDKNTANEKVFKFVVGDASDEFVTEWILTIKSEYGRLHELDVRKHYTQASHGSTE